MKIFTDGCKQAWCQLPRIEEGFRALGHEITTKPEEADLMYSNNPWFDEISKLWSDLATHCLGAAKLPKVILNVILIRGSSIIM